MAHKNILPPLDGTVNVLPGFVDFHAEYNPSSPYAIFPSTTGVGNETVSFHEYAQATHRIAHSLRPGRKGPEREIVAVLIHCDSLLYLALIPGMVRAGLIPFPMSPRNSPEGVCSMLLKTGCRKVITHAPLSALTSAMESQMNDNGHPIELIQLPELRAIYPTLGGHTAQSVQPYPPGPTIGEPDDIVLYLHSSGSTGFPKPIPQTNKTILQWCYSELLLDARRRNIRWASAALPSFHTLAIFMQLYSPLVSGEFGGLYTPQAPAPPVVPSPQSVIEVSQVTGCDGIFIIPSFIEVWAQSPENVEYLTTLKMLSFAGGPLSDVNGDKLAAAGVKLYSCYGGTEFGSPSDICDADDTDGLDTTKKTSRDWSWMRFSKTMNPEFVPQGDGTYELHLLTGPLHQPAIENLPNAKGYATSDLWEPHPTKEGLWRIVGRTDDVIVLGSGEKIVPIHQESFLGHLPFVNGAIMFGRGKNQAGVLIEPRPQDAVDPKDENAVNEFRRMIWPYVEEANKLAPTFARIFKELIILTDPAKPMARAPKGTVIRKMVVASYASEMEELYQALEASAEVADDVAPPSSWDVGTVEEWLLHHATSVNKGQEPSSTVDLFAQGFDSLSVTFLRNRIISALRSTTNPSAQAAISHIPQEFIFTHPTLQKLSAAIAYLVEPDKYPLRPRTPSEEIELMLTKYSTNLPMFSAQGDRTPGRGTVVLLTGSTGSLGSHILANLLQDAEITAIYTLDRGTTSAERQEFSFKERGLSLELLQVSKLTRLTGDLSREDLGLEQQTLAEVQASVTHIIHNAWKLDFNLSLGSFESHIAGTRKLIDFSANCYNSVKFLFSSSISAAQTWTLSTGPVPEIVLSDHDVAIGTGYGSSKYVSERLLARAKANGLQTMSVRIGQVSGSSKTGAWNATDWVPIIIKSSVALGYLPDLPGNVSWVPVDVVSRTIVDAVVSSNLLPPVINLVHPHPVSWTYVFEAANSALGGHLQVIPFDNWFKKLESRSSNATKQDLDNIPAIKLLRFFRLVGEGSHAIPLSSYSDGTAEAGGQPQFINLKAQQLSETLRTAKPISTDNVKLWIDAWRAGPWKAPTA